MHPAKPTHFLGSHPLFRNFLLTNTLSLMGSNIFDVAIPLFVLEKTHSAVALSLVSAALNLPFLLMAPFTGYSADHFNRRRLLLASDLGQILCMIFLLVYDVSGSSVLWPILLLVFATKTFLQTSETVMTFQLIPALVPSKHLAEANTWFLSTQRFIHVGGPLTAGVLLGTFGIRACLVVNILSFAANLYLVYSTKHLNHIVEQSIGGRRPLPFSMRGIFENFHSANKYIWKSSLFRPFIVMMFLWNLSAFLPNTPSTAYYFTKTEGLDARNYGLIISLIGAFNMIGFLASGPIYKRFKFKHPFLGGCLAQAVLATLGLLFLRQPLSLAILLALSRGSASLVSLGTFMLRQTQIPRARSGAVNASLRMAFMSAAPLSAMAQGFIIETLGVEVALFTGVLCLWGTFLYARKLVTALGSAAEEMYSEEKKAA